MKRNVAGQRLYSRISTQQKFLHQDVVSPKILLPQLLFIPHL